MAKKRNYQKVTPEEEARIAERQRRVRERTVGSDLGKNRFTRVSLHLRLHAAIPIILAHPRVPFDDVSVHVSGAKIIHDGLAALGFGLEQTVGDRFAFRRGRSGLQVIVNDAEITALIAAVHGPMHPVEQHVIHESEVAIHADAGIAAGIARPEIVMERAVQSANRAAERVVVSVQTLAKDRVLDRDVHRRKF